MSAVYDRVISVTRPLSQLTANGGKAPYLKEEQGSEAPVTGATGLAASIQYDRFGAKPTPGLPGDEPRSGSFKVYVRGAAGLIQNNDIITDDVGLRYTVIAAPWNAMFGFTLMVQQETV